RVGRHVGDDDLALPRGGDVDAEVAGLARRHRAGLLHRGGGRLGDGLEPGQVGLLVVRRLGRIRGGQRPEEAEQERQPQQPAGQLARHDDGSRMSEWRSGTGALGRTPYFVEPLRGSWVSGNRGRYGTCSLSTSQYASYTSSPKQTTSSRSSVVFFCRNCL